MSDTAAKASTTALKSTSATWLIVGISVGTVLIIGLIVALIVVAVLPRASSSTSSSSSSSGSVQFSITGINNQWIYYDQGIGVFTATIATGIYGGTDLAAAMQTGFTVNVCMYDLM